MRVRVLGVVIEVGVRERVSLATFAFAYTCGDAELCSVEWLSRVLDATALSERSETHDKLSVVVSIFPGGTSFSMIDNVIWNVLLHQRVVSSRPSHIGARSSN